MNICRWVILSHSTHILAWILQSISISIMPNVESWNCRLCLQLQYKFLSSRVIALLPWLRCEKISIRLNYHLHPQMGFPEYVIVSYLIDVKPTSRLQTVTDFYKCLKPSSTVDFRGKGLQVFCFTSSIPESCQIAFYKIVILGLNSWFCNWMPHQNVRSESQHNHVTQPPMLVFTPLSRNLVIFSHYLWVGAVFENTASPLSTPQPSNPGPC